LRVLLIGLLAGLVLWMSLQVGGILAGAVSDSTVRSGCHSARR
jgi:hypothetical protein